MTPQAEVRKETRKRIKADGFAALLTKRVEGQYDPDTATTPTTNPTSYGITIISTGGKKESGETNYSLKEAGECFMASTGPIPEEGDTLSFTQDGETTTAEITGVEAKGVSYAMGYHIYFKIV